jgi:hypothetical protein
VSEKQRLLRRIKAGQKITGQDAFAAAGLGLGDLYRSEDGSFALSTTRTLGIRTPAGRKQKMY